MYNTKKFYDEYIYIICVENFGDAWTILKSLKYIILTQLKQNNTWVGFI